MVTNFQKCVTGASPLITLVISSHLWLEYLLVRCLHVVIPQPEALFGDRGLSFPLLVSLAEAHAVIQHDFAQVLRQVNALRNKYAHRLAFEPADTEIGDLQRVLREMEEPFLISHVPPSDREMALAVASICGYMERRARELGATQIDVA